MHWKVLGATDFPTVEVWRLGRLVRYHVLFVIRLSSRKVNIAGVIPEPDRKVECRERLGGLLRYYYRDAA
jgi:hypothetical protein